MFIEFVVFRFMDFSVQHTLADEELRPLEVGITREKSVVEVKKR
jgi:hypothetical protein